ncbi:MAG: OB-fold domain-containing protein [Mycobacteriales bacterium]
MSDGGPVAGLAADYWRGAERGELVLQQCLHCGLVRHYPQVLCPRCTSFEVGPLVATGRGTVHSWTVAHHPYDPVFADEVPYVLLTVDMEEGVRVLGRFPEADGLCLGLPVQLGFTRDGTAQPRPVFSRRVADAGAAAGD